MQSVYAKIGSKATKVATKNEFWNYRVFSVILYILRRSKNRRLVHRFILFSQKLNEGFEFSLYKNILESGMNVIDIGANMGLYTFEASKKVFPNGSVFSFEPETSTRDVLDGRLKRHRRDNVLLYPEALSDKKGRQKLYFDEANIGGHSFSKRNPYKSKTHSIVETTTLDDHFRGLGIIDKIDLIKIDTQGAEGIIMMGGRELLEKSKPIVLLEFWPGGMSELTVHPSDLLDLFVDLNYSINIIDKANKKTYAIEKKQLINLFSENNPNGQLDIMLIPKSS